MAKYLEYSGRIYDIYLKYVAPEDMHVYSIDEVFMDVTHYLNTYQMTRGGACGKDHPGCAGDDGHHVDGGDRHESVSQQDCHGYCGEAYSAGQTRRADCESG